VSAFDLGYHGVPCGTGGQAGGDGQYTSAVVDARLVEALRAKLRCQSKDCVQETLGISSNTWVKMKRGEPIRRSTAEQLIQRFGL